MPIDDVIGRIKPQSQFSIRRFRRIGSVYNIATRNNREIGADRSRISQTRICSSDKLFEGQIHPNRRQSIRSSNLKHFSLEGRHKILDPLLPKV